MFQIYKPYTIIKNVGSNIEKIEQCFKNRHEYRPMDISYEFELKKEYGLLTITIVLYISRNITIKNVHRHNGQ